MSTGKWGKAFWADLAERVGSTLVGALLGVFTLTGTTPIDWSDGKVVWTILGVPTVVSLLKGLLSNLPGDLPSSSVVGVTSTPVSAEKVALAEVHDTPAVDPSVETGEGE